MTKLQHKHAGIILAAGASSRMGQPKALLETPSGKSLALHQADVLRNAGLEDVVLVLGHDGLRIAEQINSDAVTTIQNDEWERGRLTSIQAAAMQLRQSFALGAVILPVDTVGVQSDTIKQTIEFANITPTSAVRPVESGKTGNLLWVSGGILEEVREINPSPDFRFDEWISGRFSVLEVADPAIHNNVNTPEEWEKVKQQL